MMQIVILACCLVLVTSGSPAENLKDQFCTDPRTMKKHAAYTEWADAYSCTRHRCQPGGRNLAIYTVGCKRVEAPESAIECEEVVEDTNMQFPYCCTRLRCLVVVRGEVWTRVLGQPWETLPAAPWSHMYKMKKPPPVDGTFSPKDTETGPVYELLEPEGHGKVLRASKKDAKDYAEPLQNSQSPPDIVIALSTGAESKGIPDILSLQHTHTRKDGDEDIDQRNDVEAEEAPVITEKVPEIASEERYYTSFPPTKAPKMVHRSGPVANEGSAAKSTNLQALMDAIGTRMRDIETVVQTMNSRVMVQVHPDETSGDREDIHRGRNSELEGYVRPKNSNPDNDQYERFARRHSKYLHPVEVTTEPPLYLEDAQMSGYFSDASNSVLRRSGPKAPAATYMAPVNTDTQRSALPAAESDEAAKRKKQHKKSKKNRRKHPKKKRFNKVNSREFETNAVSLENSGVHS